MARPRVCSRPWFLAPHVLPRRPCQVAARNEKILDLMDQRELQLNQRELQHITSDPNLYTKVVAHDMFSRHTGGGGSRPGSSKGGTRG